MADRKSKAPPKGASQPSTTKADSVSASQPPPPASGEREDVLLAAIERLTDRVRAIETKTPRTIEGGGPDKRAERVVSATLQRELTTPIDDGERRGSVTQRESRQVSTNQGHPVPPSLLQQFPRRFDALQQIRINPDSWREGLFETDQDVITTLDGRRREVSVVKNGSDGQPIRKLWGTVLTELGIDGYGVVRDVAYMERDGSYKYTVDVPGLTSQHGDGFAEEELLPV
jgi:hypothetical protein